MGASTIDQQPAPDQVDLDNLHRFCIFRSGNDWFGIPALAVRSIIPRPELMETPHCDPTLQGICHVQNEFIAVVSFQAIDQVQYDIAPGSEQQLMILNGPQGPWGMLIDQAITLAELETSISTLGGAQDRWSKVIKGSASYENQVLQVLDANALYRYAAGILESFWQTGTQHAFLKLEQPSS